MGTTFGYVYAPDSDPGPLAGAKAGAVVRRPDPSPPWIVVDHAIESTLVARWPGRLWRVEVLDVGGIEQASARANYTRALAVRVLEEIPACRLFGERGEQVAAVVRVACRLDLPAAERLAESRPPDADGAYSRCWHRWLTRDGRGPAAENDDYSGTLAAGSGGARSPVNCGLTLLHREVWDRAEAIQGPAAFVLDEEGERSLGPVWSRAAAALLDAAVALGAPSLVPPEDAAVLTTAWDAFRRKVG